MIRQYFQQAWAQLCQQPLISGVTVAGTALSIFLIMLVVMMQQVQVEPFAPESNRDRFLHVRWGSITNEAWENGSSNGPWSETALKEIYGKMTTPEAVTVYRAFPQPKPVNLPGQPSTTVDIRETDSQYWKVFDFTFTDAKPYDQATFAAGQPVAVITESVARLLFGSTQVSGKEFLLAHAPYRVCGVVKDVSTLASNAYAQVWIPYTSTDLPNNTWCDNLMGEMSCTILARQRKDFPLIRDEADRRLDEFNKIIGKNGYKIINRNRPYDQEKDVLSAGANFEPNVERARNRRFIIFLILLIVPAINLSSMTQSRLRRRTAEIGVRRAFGCTRMELLGQILGENLIVTLLAGVLGLALSLLFAFLSGDAIFTQHWTTALDPPVINASILLHASTFGWALLFCFVLNLLSSGIPAWRASRMNIVEAFNGRAY